MLCDRLTAQLKHRYARVPQERRGRGGLVGDACWDTRSYSAVHPYIRFTGIPTRPRPAADLAGYPSAL